MNKLKKFISITLVFSILMCMVSSANAESNEVQYVPDEKLILGSAQIKYLIGNETKIKFRTPDANYDSELECELFPENSPHPDDIYQGSSGICYILAALSSIAENQPEIIKQAMKDNGDGTVTVKLYDLITAKPKFIKVQKTIPDLPQNCMFLKKGCLWVELMLKAMIAMNLEKRACSQLTKEMNYEKIEGGFAAPVLKMVTGKDGVSYNDYDLYKKGPQKVFDLIKDSIENGSGIITCDFNHNRFNAMFRTLLRIPASDMGLVYGHAYSVVDAYKDEKNEQWITIRNPWGSFNTTYDEYGNRIVDTKDKYSSGYTDVKLKDFYKCCGSLQILSNDNLKPMTLMQLLREKSRSKESTITLSMLIFFGLLFIEEKNIVLNQDMIRQFSISYILANLIIW